MKNLDTIMKAVGVRTKDEVKSAPVSASSSQASLRENCSSESKAVVDNDGTDELVQEREDTHEECASSVSEGPVKEETLDEDGMFGESLAEKKHDKIPIDVDNNNSEVQRTDDNGEIEVKKSCTGDEENVLEHSKGTEDEGKMIGIVNGNNVSDMKTPDINGAENSEGGIGNLEGVSEEEIEKDEAKSRNNTLDSAEPKHTTHTSGPGLKTKAKTKLNTETLAYLKHEVKDKVTDAVTSIKSNVKETVKGKIRNRKPEKGGVAYRKETGEINVERAEELETRAIRKGDTAQADDDDDDEEGCYFTDSNPCSEDEGESY